MPLLIRSEKTRIIATTAQITAALANAQLSTGPRSVEGKAASSKNALKLGLYAQTPILAGEDPEELAALTRSFTDHFRPQTPIEEAFLEDLVRAEWLKRRYRRVEAEVIHARFAALPKESNPTLGDVFIQDAEGPRLLEKICRRQEVAERQFHRALTGLLQAITQRRPVLEESADAALPGAGKPTGLNPNPPRINTAPIPVRSPRDASDNPRSASDAGATPKSRSCSLLNGNIQTPGEPGTAGLPHSYTMASCTSPRSIRRP
jgi:hypothetical protein